MTNSDCYIDDGMDTLTMLNEDVEIEASSPKDTRYQRDASRIPEGFPAEYSPVKAILALEVPSPGNLSSLSRTFTKGHIRSVHSTI